MPSNNSKYTEEMREQTVKLILESGKSANPVMFSDPSGYFYQEIAYINTSNILDLFARSIDEYVVGRQRNWLMKLVYGTRNALLGSIGKYKIGLMYSIVSIVWSTIPKINDELASIRYITDKIRLQ